MDLGIMMLKICYELYEVSVVVYVGYMPIFEESKGL
jgi:hypothetical protein